MCVHTHAQLQKLNSNLHMLHSTSIVWHKRLGRKPFCPTPLTRMLCMLTRLLLLLGLLLPLLLLSDAHRCLGTHVSIKDKYQ